MNQSQQNKVQTKRKRVRTSNRPNKSQYTLNQIQNNKSQMGIPINQDQTPKFYYKNKNQLSTTKFGTSQQFASTSIFREQYLNDNQNQGKLIDPKIQAIQTQNVPFIIPNQKISKLYLISNIFLILMCITLLIVGVIPGMKTLVIIVIGGISACLYILYILTFIKCTKLKSINFLYEGSQEYQKYFDKLKNSRSYFKITILGDKINFTDKDQIRELIYQPEIKDKSGVKTYHIGLLNTKMKQEQSEEQNCQRIKQQVINKNINSMNRPLNQNHQNQNFMIAIVKFHKKYCFSTQQSKNLYLKQVQEFYGLNKELFKEQSQIKGYKRIQYIIEDWQPEKSYLILNKKQKNQVTKTKTKKQKNRTKSNILCYKVQIKDKNKIQKVLNQNSHSIMVLNNNQQSVQYIEDEIKMQRIENLSDFHSEIQSQSNKQINELSIQSNIKNKKQFNRQRYFDKNQKNQINSQSLPKIQEMQTIQKPTTQNQQRKQSSENIQKNQKQQNSQQQVKEKNSNQIQNQQILRQKKSQYFKYMTIFKLGYWITLILGFGVFYQIFIQRKYVKRYQIGVIKEIRM